MTNKSFLSFLLLIYCIFFCGTVLAQDITISSNTIWTPGNYNYNNVNITNGAILTFNGAVTLTCDNLFVDFNSTLSADGTGYPALQKGPGAGGYYYYTTDHDEYFGGAGYGGKGGDAWRAKGGKTYGSSIAPVDLGSSNAASGGGAIRLIVNDTLSINGNISANGSDGWRGPGSGGSIYITAKNLLGSGTVRANGGNESNASFRSGGGGGGRIAVYFQNSTFSGIAETKGGTGVFGTYSGNAGTVGFFDTPNNIFYAGHSFRIQENDGPFNFNKIILNNSIITSEGNVNISADEISISNTTFTLGGAASKVTTRSISVSNNSSVNLNDSCVINSNSFLTLKSNSRFTFNGPQVLNVPSITVDGSSVLILSGTEQLSVTEINLINNSNIAHLPQGKIYLNLNNLTIDPTSTISADGAGYPAWQGPGTGGNYQEYYGGAGYGGKGGDARVGRANGGISYGSVTAPIDLGSSTGGSGGGAIRLIVNGTLTIDGNITANGTDDPRGAGSGGSIYITAKDLAGAGMLKANGGKGINYYGYYRSGGGGGGRVAVYYQNSNFSVIAEAKGGLGYPFPVPYAGQDGTVKMEGVSEDSFITNFYLTEKSHSVSTLPVVLSSQKVNLSNNKLSGDLNGTLNFADFEIVSIKDGAFSNNGYAKGNWQATLEGISYSGTWQGMVYSVPSENKIYLKGNVSGDIGGVYVATFSKSVPDSAIYDQYQSTWNINRINTNTISTTINLEGNLNFLPEYVFNSDIYLYQADMEGSAYGFYTGPLSAVVTHISLTGENEYKGQGFSVISYNSSIGQGKAYSYDKLASNGKVELVGLCDSPLSGSLSGVLDEIKSPKVLSGTIERLDFGLEPAPELKVKVWGPPSVSPGQTVNYIIEYRNDGVKAATEAIVCFYPDLLVSYKSASKGGYFNNYAHRVTWNLGALNAKSSGYLSIQTGIPWGIPRNLVLENRAYILNIILNSTEENGASNGMVFDSEDVNGNKDYEQFMHRNNAKWFKLYDKTNFITGALEAFLASLDIATFRNGVGAISEISGYRPNWISYSASTRTYVTQAEKNRLNGDVLYLISPQLIIQNDLKNIKGRFKKIVVYQGDDLMPDQGVTFKTDAFTLTIPWSSLPNTLNKENMIKLFGDDNSIVDLIKKVEESENNKTFKCLEVFPQEPGNKIKINWEDGTSTEIVVTHLLQSEEGIEVITIPGIEHNEWIQLFNEFKIREFKIKYGRFPESKDDFDIVSKIELPTSKDVEKLKSILNDLRGNQISKVKQQIVNAHDPNELLVFPEGEVRPGDKLNYTINYENEGKGNAYGVYITDILEEDLDDSTLIINNNGVYYPSTRTIKWFIGELVSKQKGSLSFSVNVKQESQDKAEVINFATVYFPSVPEETRTNGTVNSITTALLDSIPPKTTIIISPQANQSGWNNTNVSITLTASDNEGGLGVKEIHYKVIGQESNEAIVSGNTANITISSEGTTTLTYWSVDNVDNIEPSNSQEIKIDKTSPTITALISPQPNSNGWNKTDVTVSFTATEDISGIAIITDPLDVTTEGKNQLIGGQAIDLAGNVGSIFATLNIDKTAPRAIINADPSIIWPPDNKLIDVIIGGNSIDNLSGVAVNSFKVIDEYGKIEPILQNFNNSIKLEASRYGTDADGRNYTITLITKDKADNQAEVRTTVLCPHDQRK